MNDSDFEDQLRALSPAAPSPHLAERIGRQLAAPRTAAPTAGMIERPAPPRSASGWLWNLGWAGAGAVIALAAVTSFSLTPKGESVPKVSIAGPTDTARVVATASSDSTPPSTPTSTTEEQAFEPAQSSRELIAVDNSNELLETADGPVREVRYTYMERLAWAHPATGARLEMEVPREDVYLIPVSLQ